MTTQSSCRLPKPSRAIPASNYAPARRALQVALLDQVGLEHVLDGVARLADRGGEVVHADRAAAEFLQHGAEQLAVHDIEAEVVDVEHGQRGVGHRA
jgi:hypothetical protein